VGSPWGDTAVARARGELQLPVRSDWPGPDGVTYSVSLESYGRQVHRHGLSRAQADRLVRHWANPHATPPPGAGWRRRRGSRGGRT